MNSCFDVRSVASHSVRPFISLKFRHVRSIMVNRYLLPITKSRTGKESGTVPMPEIDALHRKKPLCYDPARQEFIFFDEIVSGQKNIVPVETLSKADLKKLVIERQRSGPDYKVQAISGPLYTRDDVVRAIEQDEPFGQVTLEAEVSYLRDLLNEIEQNLE